MKKRLKRKGLKPRLPLEAALKLHSHPVLEQGGEKIYDRKRRKEQNRKIVKEYLIEEKD